MQTVRVGSVARHLSELDSLRGIAIVLVFLFHVRPRLWPTFFVKPEIGLVNAFAHAGHTGVSLFFILSGFLLSLPFLEEAAGGRRVDRGRYFARRALRILPLYYVVVIAGAVLTSKHVVELARALPYLVFANSIRGWWRVPIDPFTSVLWSLATEVQFYFVLPLLPLLVARRTRVLGVIALGAYAVAYGLFLAGHLKVGSATWAVPLHHSLFGRGWLFLYGVAAAWVFRTYGERVRAAMNARAIVRNGGADLLLLAVVLCLAVLLRWAARGGYFVVDAIPLHAWHLAEGFLWTSVLLLALLAPLRTKPLWCNPVLAHLGVLSYSIYLLHLPFMTMGIGASRAWLDQSLWHGLAGGCLLTLALLLLCEMTYRWIERPFLVRKERIAS